MLLGGTLFVCWAPPASAHLAGPGITGLISTPTPETLPEGTLVVGAAWLEGSNTYLYAPKANRILAVAAGLLPGLEVSFRLTQIVGMVDPEAPGVTFNTDRMANFKYRVPFTPMGLQLAVGMQDIASANELSGLPMRHGTSQYGQSTIYGVVGGATPRWGWHAGWGTSQASINGPFGGLELRPWAPVALLAEYDSRHVNVGVRLYPFEPVSLQLASLGGATWAMGASFALRL